jgi:serine/threonine-protein kinase RsbT
MAAEYASEEARASGFGTNACAELALAVSEIAQNVIRYGVRGEAHFFRPNGNGVFKVVIEDEGPGIRNLETAMKKGFSTAKGSLGIGLDVARRSVDEFSIKTNREEGTEVVLQKFLPIPEDAIAYGVVSLADENYAINGDEYLVKEYDGNKVLMAVIDGTGEGYRAHATAMAIKEYLTSHYRLPLKELVLNCHELLRKSDLDRGAAVALARIASGQVEYIGIGDTHCYLAGASVNFLNNHEGTVGEHQLPTLHAASYDIPEGSYLIMCTDGIRSNLWFDEDLDTSAQQVANMVFNEFHKEYGDVTVLVARFLLQL